MSRIVILVILLSSILLIIIGKQCLDQSLFKDTIIFIGYLATLIAVFTFISKLFVRQKLKTKQSVNDKRFAKKYNDDINSLLKRIDKERLNFEKFQNSNYKFTATEEIHSKETAFQLMKEELMKFKISYRENRFLINKAIKQIELIKETRNYDTRKLLRTLKRIKSKYI